MNLKSYILFFLMLGCGFQAKGQDLAAMKKAKPFALSGSLGGNAGLYGVSGLDYRTSPYRYGLTARLNMSIYGVDVPIYATIRDHTFNFGGSFTRVRINPQYKWARLHLGDVFMNFNRYTLSGRTVRGAGVELTPGNVRLKFLYGKMEDLRAFTDTLLLGTVFQPTYSRRTAALAIGFGSRQSYFDLYAVRTWDNLDSLNGTAMDRGITRQSNTVAGATLRIRILRNLSLQGNMGLSFLTDNLESIGENFVFGENRFTSSLVEGNLSSSLSYAGDASMQYQGKSFSLQVMSQYIRPYYQPLSVAFINSDLVNHTFGGILSLWKRAVNLSGSIGIQSNNLSGVKLSTSSHIIGNLAANIRFNRNWSAQLNYFNFAQDFQAQLTLIEDVYTFAVSNQIATGSIRYQLRQGPLQYTVSVKGGRNNFYTIDNNEVESGAFESYNGGLDLGFQDTEKKLRINLGFAYRHYEREAFQTGNYGVRLGARKEFLQGKLGSQFNTNFFLVDTWDKRDGFTFRNALGMDYQLNKVSNVGLYLNHITRRSEVRAAFSEIRADVRYIYQFQTAKKKT